MKPLTARNVIQLAALTAIALCVFVGAVYAVWGCLT